MGGLNVDPLRILPMLDGTTNRVEQGTLDYNGVAFNSLNAIKSRVLGSEQAIDYFREDNDLHVFHSFWHQENSNREPKDDVSKGWRFLYMHRQLLNRYLFERRVEGMEEVVPLTHDKLQERFSAWYWLDLGNDPERHLNSFTRGRLICNMSQQSLDNVREGELECDRSVRGGTEEDFVGKCEAYHDIGHNMISVDCGEEWRPQDPVTGNSVRESLRTVMADAVASARDPLFYRWHLAVDRKYDDYLAAHNSPLSFSAVRPPSGLTVTEVFLQSSRCPKNLVETYYELQPGVRYNKYSLQHDSFAVHIRLRNQNRLRRKVIVRLFLALEEFAEEMRYPIDLDMFTPTLTGRQDETIVREDFKSSFIKKANDPCGWPANLLLPKGKNEQGTNFRLVAMVHSVARDVNVGETWTSSQVLCGINNGERIKLDDRPFGFPFHYRWAFNRARVINNRHRVFGNVSARIKIFGLNDLPTRSCRAG